MVAVRSIVLSVSMLVSGGVLNLTDEDYRLNPLNPYEELVRERTYMVRCSLNF